MNMKILRVRVLSDLHLEFTDYRPEALPGVGEDVVVLAGDIGVGTGGIQWALRAIPDRPVIYVMGNHEYYHRDFATLRDDCRQLTANTHVHLLENQSLDLLGARFLGCTLWSDYRAAGAGTRAVAMAWADGAMNDFLLIDHGARRFTVHDAEQEALRSIAWLEREIAASDRPTIVVTHNAPTLKTCNPIHRNSFSNASFHNDLDRLIRAPVKLWAHGHTHYSCEAVIDSIPVLSNQRGYPREGVRFDWDRIWDVEIG